MQLSRRWGRTGRTALSTGKGPGGGVMQFLPPSQDAPDASASSVCVQGDQDTGWTDGVSLLAGPGGGMGSGGGGRCHYGNQGCLQGWVVPPSICSPALLPRKAQTPRGAPNGYGHMTQMYTDRPDGPMGVCGCARMHMGMSVQTCTCGQVCMHIYVLDGVQVHMQGSEHLGPKNPGPRQSRCPVRADTLWTHTSCVCIALCMCGPLHTHRCRWDVDI